MCNNNKLVLQYAVQYTANNDKIWYTAYNKKRVPVKCGQTRKINKYTFRFSKKILDNVKKDNLHLPPPSGYEDNHFGI